MTRREGLPPTSYTETEWGRQVDELLDLYAWDYRYHVARSQYTPWGWPDRVAIRRRDRRLLFAELKAERTVVTPDQIGLLELLLDVAGGGWMQKSLPESVGWQPWPGFVRVDVELWRPGDVDRVMEVLK